MGRQPPALGAGATGHPVGCRPRGAAQGSVCAHLFWIQPTPSCARTHKLTGTCTFTCTRVHTHSHSQAHLCTRTPVHAHAHCVLVHMRAHAHLCTRAHRHLYTHTLLCTQSHTQASPGSLICILAPSLHVHEYHPHSHTLTRTCRHLRWRLAPSLPAKHRPSPHAETNTGTGASGTQATQGSPRQVPWQRTEGAPRHGGRSPGQPRSHHLVQADTTATAVSMQRPGLAIWRPCSGGGGDIALGGRLWGQKVGNAWEPLLTHLVVPVPHMSGVQECKSDM